jgi:hypothetical protein
LATATGNWQPPATATGCCVLCLVFGVGVCVWYLAVFVFVIGALVAVAVAVAVLKFEDRPRSPFE